MNYFICFKLSHSDLLVVFLGAFPWFSNELSLFAYEYKKGASRCIYHSEAQQSLYTINANDPRPKRAVANTANRDTPQNDIPA